MTDEAKRKLIRVLSRFDRASSRQARGGSGTGAAGRMDDWAEYESHQGDIEDELSRLSGKELDRELRRQILFTLPVALFILIVLAAVIWAI